LAELFHEEASTKWMKLIFSITNYMFENIYGLHVNMNREAYDK
jgi:hypothetical protein